VRAPEEAPLPTLEVTGSWEQVLAHGSKSALEKILPGYISKCRWFGGKGRKIRAVTLGEPISMPVDSQEAQIMAMDVTYADGDPEAYLLPLAFVTGERAGEFQQAFPLRQSFRRLCVPQITFHSDWQLARPRRWNRSIPRQVLV